MIIFVSCRMLVTPADGATQLIVQMETPVMLISTNKMIALK